MKPRAQNMLEPLQSRRGTPRAFTLIELLVVIAIVGILAAIGLPRLKTLGQSNAMISGTRQLLDDIAFARQRAIANRSDVYLVFAPAVANGKLDKARPANIPNLPFPEQTALTNVFKSQYSGYAVVARRQVGDQPGQSNWRYLSSWKSLPDGIFIPTYKYNIKPGTDPNAFSVPADEIDGVLPFETAKFPFPLGTSDAINGNNYLPFIKFNYKGQIENLPTTGYNYVRNGRDSGSEIIPLARGSIFFNQNNWQADIQENPPNNSRTNMTVAGTLNTMWTRIRIDGITGRAKVERVNIK